MTPTTKSTQCFGLVHQSISYGRLLTTLKSFFFRAAKLDAHNLVDILIMARVFQNVFGQQVMTNTQQREECSTMRYAKAPSRDFRFLPGLHGARPTGASKPMQNRQGMSHSERCACLTCCRCIVCLLGHNRIIQDRVIYPGPSAQDQTHTLKHRVLSFLTVLRAE